MEDSFEKFIRDHREAFDSRDPDPALWRRIESEIRPRRVISWKAIASRAAAVVLIFAASYLVHEMIDNREPGMTARKIRSAKEQELVIPELREAEMYYSGLINEKIREIEPILAHCPAIEKELEFDMAELDSLYSDLKNDLKDNIANQEVVEAIIENYRLRISILEELLTELEPEEGACISKNNGYEL
jgi:hypothetical protein